MRELTQQEHAAVTGGAPSGSKGMSGFLFNFGWKLAQDYPVLKPIGASIGFMGSMLGIFGL